MKNRLPGLAVVLALAAPLASEAQRDNPHRIPTNLAGVTAYNPPPAGFDPIKATDEELADWGFPPRPDQTLFPEEYANWVRVRTALKTRIIPHLVQTNIVHGPLRSAGEPESVENGSLKSLNWSGYVDVNDAKKYGSSSFTDVGTTIVVPSARQAFNACDGTWDYAWSTVGIDGYKTTEIAQAGVEFDAMCSGGSTSAYYSPFYEWFPNGQVRVTNLPISPGDNYFMAVHIESATTMNVEIGNLTQGIFFGLDVTAPAGTIIVGNSAEWITERPGGSESEIVLDNYAANAYWSATAVTAKGSLSHPGSSSVKEVSMQDRKGKNISVPTHLGTSAFVVKAEGSAY
jgi:hypothetical protein